MKKENKEFLLGYLRSKGLTGIVFNEFDGPTSITRTGSCMLGWKEVELLVDFIETQEDIQGEV